MSLMAKSHVVRVEYRDGSSRLFGPVASRQEARKLAERVQSSQCRSVRISKWDGDPGKGTGVVASRPAPVPDPVDPVDPVIEVAWDQEAGELTITADQPIFADYDTEGWLDVVGSATNSAVGAGDKYVDDYTLVWANPVLNQPTTITQITFSRGPDYPSRVTEYVWTGSVLVEDAEPELTFTSFTSPAVDTLRIVGVGFDIVDRLSMGFANGSLYASNDSDPLEESTNLGNGITITTWTDTLIEFTSPYIPTGTVNAVAFQVWDPELAYVTLDEWLNTTFDPEDGFTPFTAL